MPLNAIRFFGSPAGDALDRVFLFGGQQQATQLAPTEGSSTSLTGPPLGLGALTLT